jgi:hypothetical protein
MQSESSLDLPFASWRTRKVGSIGINPSLILKVRNSGVLMTEVRRRWTTQLKQRWWFTVPLVLFYLGPSWIRIGWSPPTLVRKIFTQSIDSDANLFQKTSSKTPAFYQLSGHLLTQWSRYKIVITLTFSQAFSLLLPCHLQTRSRFSPSLI